MVDREPASDRLRRVVVTTLVESPAADPFDGELVRKVEEEHGVEPAADLGQHPVERLRLGEIPREAVEHEAVARVLYRQTLADQCHGQVVRHEVPAREDRLHPAPELGAGGDRRAKHVARRDVRDPVGGGDPLCLRPLAGPLRAQHEQVHRRKPS